MGRKLELIPLPKSKFLKVECPNCGNEQVIFSHAKSVVKCLICDNTLAIPKGGKADIKAKILAEVA
uniref:Small ribosomal subunit protein eS27 n=1 Tax=uncultured korarchaeote TaxID=161241 RepID=A0A1L2JKA5_9CREN|nr:ribosomal protein S27E [uncultured korarchaeote]